MGRRTVYGWGTALVGLLFSGAVAGFAAHAAALEGAAGRGQSVRPNTWSARSSTGATLGGTWTAAVDRKTGGVTGTWTLVDARGRVAARGRWSAAKSPAGWTGAWRAAVTGGRSEYSGTWRADVDLKADAPFGALFEKAAAAAVGGSWRAGGHSGAWSIRAFE